ncbi:asparagine synthase [Sulfuricella denitrificans skB26]|uniref:asparagine synthase (glutamine-hydrolyzing) n=1 Tax=Sulfuricella denitrificans (strain DSM 22764 / NBRC 105220 / skB26) TaxID=1163617 RepID=S6B8Y8_SULDS|nr:asparagine synthase-related protein [Sulfuricella denitrificans]BAN36787.1 asparagine synthase [Sulfuricella denitrificans skB26]
MSGLCGWIGYGATTAENRQIVERMAGPLARFDGSNIQTLVGRAGALTVAASGDSAHLYHNEGLLVAVWGRVRFMESRLALLAQAEGVAKVLADGWREKGESVLSLLEGAYALCILNEATGEVVLAVDRMGNLPLSYTLSGDGLVFGSSADAIILHPLARPEIDPQSLYNYLYFHMVPGPDTIYTGQKRLLPGEYLVFSKGRAETKKHWEMQFLEGQNRPFDELKQEFLRLLRSSVREASSDQDVGAFLSGGTDSSTIAGILGEVGGRPARTYSIGFEADGYDEMEYARIAARHFSTEHHEYYVTPDDVVAAIPQIAGIFDQPFGNASAVPTFYCARMARADGLNRILGGDGGDELFGGNDRYAKQYIFSLYERIPSLLRKGVLEPAVFGMPGGQRVPLVRKARSYIEQASVLMPARTETYNLLDRYGHEEIFTREFLATVDPGQPLSRLKETYRQTHAQSLINQMLALDLKFTLADNDLPKVVKACELAGMEVAFPFLNDEMVAFSAGLAPELKLKGTKLRYFFKEALRDFLPGEIITKQKHGFGLPFGVWLQDHKPLQELATDSLNGLKSRNIVRAEFIDKLLGQHLAEHAGYHGTMVWVLMMLEQWFRQR